ncbi:hypothetical protein HMN09_00512200 [Mycena chlorophos]|uniref:Pentatricopeptide repeat-containing protein n=1 Tax=Mycena chlorophos TaxID=658473 RepID=A0A8H6WEF4_MYCCL|nr:hypothetical protein HMN09_00512200 [Mycena chlorophos]
MLRAFSRGTVRIPLQWNQPSTADARLPPFRSDAAQSSTDCAPGGRRVTVYPLIPPPTTFELPQPAHSAPALTHRVRHHKAASVPRSWQSPPLPLTHSRVYKHGQLTLAGLRYDHFEDLDLPLLFDKERSLRERVDLVAWRRDLLRVLGNTQSVSQGWKAYDTLASVPFTIPHGHLNRLVSLIARERTKTRPLFSRLLAVLTAIHRSGWEITTHQWNALIDNAGKGYRKAHIDDFRTAFRAFCDLVSSQPPNAYHKWLSEGTVSNPLPDIHTYTTLINHAVNTRNAVLVEQTTSLLKVSGLVPDRMTHLVLLKFYSWSGNLAEVNACLARIQLHGFDLGIDGVNACMWAFSRYRRLDMVLHIYRVLRHNVVPDVNPDDIDSIQNMLMDDYIEIPPTMLPNEVTYTLVAQAAAYHGELGHSLRAFTDMLSTDNVEVGAPLDEELKPLPYAPTLALFRALFLGFYRHGVPELGREVIAMHSMRPWSLEALIEVFDAFLTLPEHLNPSGSTLYWLLVSFKKTSDNDVALLASVWERLEAHFNPRWSSSNHIDRIRSRFFENNQT